MPAPGAGALGHRGNPGLAAARRLAHDVAEHGGEHGDAVLLLAGQADDRALAVALRRIRPQQFKRNGRHFPADRIARLHQR